MPDPTAVKRALAGLASGPPTDETVLANAARARTSLDTAAAFVESGGLDRLRAVVERTDSGVETLDAFERYHAACQFHSGHATDLSAGPKDVPD